MDLLARTAASRGGLGALAFGAGADSVRFKREEPEAMVEGIPAEKLEDVEVAGKVFPGNAGSTLEAICAGIDIVRERAGAGADNAVT